MDLQLITDLQKTPESLARSRAEAQSIHPLPDFFSEDELKYLRELKNRAYACEENLRHRQGANSHKPSDVMAWPTGEVHQQLNQFFREKISPYLKGDYEYGFAFHKNYHPYGLHTDAGYDPEEVIYRQGIVPLELASENSTSYTVIMKQKCFFSCSFPAKIQYRKEEQEYVDEMRAKWIGDFRTDYLMPESDLEKYWLNNEFYRERLQGFEIDHAFKWKLGDTIIWDRSQIHCSSDFDRFGLDYKVGLMWVTKLLS